MLELGWCCAVRGKPRVKVRVQIDLGSAPTLEVSPNRKRVPSGRRRACLGSRVRAWLAGRLAWRRARRAGDGRSLYPALGQRSRKQTAQSVSVEVAPAGANEQLQSASPAVGRQRAKQPLRIRACHCPTGTLAASLCRRRSQQSDARQPLKLSKDAAAYRAADRLCPLLNCHLVLNVNSNISPWMILQDWTKSKMRTFTP